MSSDNFFNDHEENTPRSEEKKPMPPQEPGIKRAKDWTDYTAIMEADPETHFTLTDVMSAIHARGNQ